MVVVACNGELQIMLTLLKSIDMNRTAVLFILLTVHLFACKKNNVAGDEVPDPQQPEHKTWRIFNTTNSAIPDDQVNVICIDNQNKKWLGTSKGVAVLEDERWTIFNELNSPLPSQYVTSIAAEADGTVWIGTNGGLVSVDGNTWKVYTSQNSLLPENGILSLATDTISGTVWVGTGKGLVSIRESAWKLYDETDGLLLYSLVADATGAVWMGAFDHFQFQGSIRKLSNGSWTAIRLEPAGYPSTFPYAIAVNGYNSVYALLTGTSVSTVVNVTGSLLTELPKPAGAGGLRAMTTEGRRVWVGGSQLSIFGDVQSPLLKIPGADYNILALAVDKSGRKWIGTAGGGLVVYSPA
jgi:ligand-binding sensor domain-containing protein